MVICFPVPAMLRCWGCAWLQTRYVWQGCSRHIQWRIGTAHLTPMSDIGCVASSSMTFIATFIARYPQTGDDVHITAFVCMKTLAAPWQSLQTTQPVAGQHQLTRTYDACCRHWMRCVVLNDLPRLVISKRQAGDVHITAFVWMKPPATTRCSDMGAYHIFICLWKLRL